MRCLAVTGEFEDFLNQALRDCFVCWLSAEGMQKRSLSEPDLSIARALELARSIEAAVSETNGFKEPNSIAGASGKVLDVGGAAASVVSLCQNLAHWADLLIIDVGATTTRDGHVGTSNPNVACVEKLVTSHLSVEEVQQKIPILEMERRAGRQMW